MAQQYPPQGGRGGGRGGGGRGGGGVPGATSYNPPPTSYGAVAAAGLGIPAANSAATVPQQQQQQQPPPQQQQQQQPQQQQQQQGRPMGAWQPAAPTSLQAAVAYGGPPPQQQQQQPPGAGQAPPPRGPPPHQMQNPYGHQHHPPPFYNPYTQQAAYGGAPPPPRGSWQGGGAPGPGGAGGGGFHPNASNMRGGVFYPAMHQMQHHPQQFQHGSGGVGGQHVPSHQHHQPAPRPKKALLITDKAGNVLDLSSVKKPAAGGTSLQQAAAAGAAEVSSKPTTSSQDAGAKMRQAALERLQGENKEKKQAEEKAKKEAEEKAKKEAEEKAKKEAEEKAKKEAEEKAKKEAEEKAKKEAEEKAKKEAEEKAKKEAEEKARKQAEEEEKKRREEEEKARKEKEAKEAAEAAEAAAREKEEKEKEKSSLQALLSKAADEPNGHGAAVSASRTGRIIYTKQALLGFRSLPACMERPETLPSMTIVRGPSRGKSGPGRSSGRGDGGGGGGGGGGEWSRGNAPPPNRRQQSDGGGGGGGGGGQWARGQAPPPQKRDQNRQRGPGRGRNQQPLYDGPVAPLVKSENHWKPKKNTSELVVAEKQVKSILNKMTKEKFDRLSSQMVSIPILSYEMLTMMINNVYDKAIDEPAFGDMYADLCVKLSQSVQGSEFVHIIESDEEPPTEGAAEPGAPGESSSYTVFRWSNDVSTTDSEIVGPFTSSDACFEAALSSEEREPSPRGEVVLTLETVIIKRGVFIKVMKKKDQAEGAPRDFFAVFFPVAEAEECGQQLSDIFLSRVECVSDANKKNTFKRSLLNKCEEEFNKQDIYVDWKKEKKAYEDTKSSLEASARAEKEEELGFRRMRIKKQMLGNIKFIGQLYKKGLLKEKIMRYCIAALLKLEEIKDDVKRKNPEYNDLGDTDMDEEDHEAICSMFATIGKTIDTLSASTFMKVCFDKIAALSQSKTLPARSRFMYKDLLDLRANSWVPRRNEEKAKTIDEIRQDFEREERRQAQQSQQAHMAGGRGRGNDYQSGRGAGRGTNRGVGRGDRQTSYGASRPRQPKPSTETDADGFTTVVVGSKAGATGRGQSPRTSQPRAPQVTPAKKGSFAALAEDRGPSPPKQSSNSNGNGKPAPLSDELLDKRIKSMRSEFMSEGDEKELLLSMDELSGTQDAGMKLVMANTDRMMDCKENERQACLKIVTILAEKGKLTAEDVQSGLADPMEFLDSTVMDAPKAYDYMAELLAQMLRIRAVTVAWLCEQCEKQKAFSPKAPEKTIRSTIEAVRSVSGADAAKKTFGSADKALSDVLGAATWKSVSQEL